MLYVFKALDGETKWKGVDGSSRQFEEVKEGG